MAVVVSEITEAARDVHASLDPITHPDSVCLRFLNRYHKRLIQRVAQINPDEISLFHDISLPLADFDAGEAANDAHQYASGKAFFIGTTDLWDRLELVAWESRDQRIFFPAYSFINGTIRLHGVAEDWTLYDSLQLRYIPMTANLTTASNIVLPDTAEDCMVTALAYWLMRRQPEQPYRNYMRELREEWLLAEKTFLGEIAGRKKMALGQINEVW